MGVLFRCCRVYQRLYLAADRRAYEGGCPRCGRRLRLVVAPDGAEGRFFEAGG